MPKTRKIEKSGFKDNKRYYNFVLGVVCHSGRCCIHAGTFFFCYYLVKESGVEYDSSPWIFSVHDILYFRLSIRFV